MRVLVACEESQAVCKAFRALGHEAYSCDILPCSGGYPEWHILGDVLQVLKGTIFVTEDGIVHENSGWDIMIAHPPCTYLCIAGYHYSLKDPARMKKTEDAAEFFMKLYNSDIPMIAVENPAGTMSKRFRKPDQIINPFQFGHPERKQTCLWLRGLPKLIPQTNLEVKPIKTIIRKSGKKAGQPYNYYWRQGKSAKERSKTFPGIAKAMAEQWGNLSE